MCKHCQNKLEEVVFDQKEFEKLKSVFFSNCIIGKNIFNKTTPEELEKFKMFMRKAEPYDIVIDGLNVAYCAGNKQPTHVYANMVTKFLFVKIIKVLKRYWGFIL